MWKRDKKKLKKELSLNYTVMLLPHSQDKPIHFKIPVWVFIAAFFSLFTLLSLTLFFSYSSYRLRGAAEQKTLLEAELRELDVEKARLNEEKERLVGDNLKIAMENADLLESQKNQEDQLEELKALSDQVAKELEELNQRERGIREKLGLEEETEHEDSSSETPLSVDGSPLSTAKTGGVQPDQVHEGLAQALSGPVNLTWVEQPSVSAMVLEQELRSLENSIRIRENSYDAIGGVVEQYAVERQNSSIRQKIVNYALQFVGNSYVYGGNDPHSGVDCSGFSRYILSHIAGVNLDRTSSSQSHQGTSVSIDNARQGDLIFYGSSSGVNHVAIYMGNGKVVHASNEKTGITVSDWNYREPVAIKNVID